MKDSKYNGNIHTINYIISYYYIRLIKIYSLPIHNLNLRKNYCTVELNESIDYKLKVFYAVLIK